MISRCIFLTSRPLVRLSPHPRLPSNPRSKMYLLPHPTRKFYAKLNYINYFTNAPNYIIIRYNETVRDLLYVPCVGGE